MSYCFYGNYSLYTSPSVGGRVIEFPLGPDTAATRRARFLSQPNLRMFGAATTIKSKAESIQVAQIGESNVPTNELIPLTSRWVISYREIIRWGKWTCELGSTLSTEFWCMNVLFVLWSFVAKATTQRAKLCCVQIHKKCIQEKGTREQERDDWFFYLLLSCYWLYSSLQSISIVSSTVLFLCEYSKYSKSLNMRFTFEVL